MSSEEQRDAPTASGTQTDVQLTEFDTEENKLVEQPVTSQVFEYYSKYSLSKQLPKYFCGETVNIKPSQIIHENVEVLNQQWSRPSLIGQDLDDSLPRIPSPTSSINSNRKLEWDNGADIGYENSMKNKQRSVSLPTLTTLERLELKKSALRLSPEGVTMNESVLNALANVQCNKSDKESSQNNIVVVLSSNSSSNSKEEIQNEVPKEQQQSTRVFMKILKKTIGFPKAESTPKYQNTNICNSYENITETSCQIDFKKSKSHADVNTPCTKTSKISLQITKPLHVECIASNPITAKNSNKYIQTSLQRNTSIGVQTDFDVSNAKPLSPKNMQSIIFVQHLSDGSLSIDSATQTASTNSFEYLRNVPPLNLNEIRQATNSNFTTVTTDSSLSSEDCCPLANLLQVQLSKNLITDVEKSLELMQKLLRSRKYDSTTKKHFIKLLVKKIVNTKYSDDSTEIETTNTSTSVRSVDDNDALQKSLHNNKPWIPPTMKSFNVENTDALVPTLEHKLTHSKFTLPKNKSTNSSNDDLPKKFALPPKRVVQSASTTLSDNSNKTHDEPPKSWRDFKTTSEQKFETKRNDKCGGDQLVDFARKERDHQLSWIRNEITHLSKLKQLLEDKNSAKHKALVKTLANIQFDTFPQEQTAVYCSCSEKCCPCSKQRGVLVSGAVQRGNSLELDEITVEVTDRNIIPLPSSSRDTRYYVEQAHKSPAGTFSKNNIHPEQNAVEVPAKSSKDTNSSERNPYIRSERTVRDYLPEKNGIGSRGGSAKSNSELVSKSSKYTVGSRDVGTQRDAYLKDNQSEIADVERLSKDSTCIKDVGLQGKILSGDRVWSTTNSADSRIGSARSNSEVAAKTSEDTASSSNVGTQRNSYLEDKQTIVVRQGSTIERPLKDSSGAKDVASERSDSLAGKKTSGKRLRPIAEIESKQKEISAGENEYIRKTEQSTESTRLTKDAASGTSDCFNRLSSADDPAGSIDSSSRKSGKRNKNVPDNEVKISKRSVGHNSDSLMSAQETSSVEAFDLGQIGSSGSDYSAEKRSERSKDSYNSKHVGATLRNVAPNLLELKIPSENAYASPVTPETLKDTDAPTGSSAVHKPMRTIATQSSFDEKRFSSDTKSEKTSSKSSKSKETNTSSGSSTKSGETYDLKDVISFLCKCCKKPLNERAIKIPDEYILCHPCYRYNQYSTPSYQNPGHVCNCYTTNTLNKMKKCMEELSALEIRPCMTCGGFTNCNRMKPFWVKRKCSCTKKSKRPVAYVLTFDENNDTNDLENSDRTVPKELEEVTVKIPFRPNKKRNKNIENAKTKRKTDYVSSSDESAKNIEKKPSNTKNSSLQQALLTNNPNFIQSAEERRKCLIELAYLREERCNKYKQLLAATNGELPSKESLDQIKMPKPKNRLFNSKVMKKQTEQKYKKLPEVQQKLLDNRERQQRKANRLLADIYNKKLQKNTLKGYINLSPSVNLLDSLT